MKKIKNLDRFAEKLKLIGEIVVNTQVSTSPKMQNVLKGLQSIDKAQQTLKQVQQVQELISTGKKDPSDQNSIETALPLLLLVLNSLSSTKSAEEAIDITK